MTIQPSILDLQLEKLTYGGDAMVRLDDGRAVFVPFGLPREGVRVRLTEERRNFVRAELLEILEASPHRVVPRCKHFGVCGGCHYQHLLYEKMAEHLLANLALTRSRALLDVYYGVGLFSAFLAPICEHVIGVESSSSACEDFSFNLDEFDNVELYEGPAEEVIPHLDVQPDIVLVDPPRAGLDKRVVDGILNLAPRVIAYISCDPSTLARDSARLIRGGYRLRDVTPFNLFPQTFHIESISIFER